MSCRHIAVASFMLLLAACSSRVTPDNYEKLKAGMTKAQVHDIIGPPDEVTGDDIGGVLSLTKETWRSGKHMITVTFGNDALALKTLETPKAKEKQ